MSRNAWIIDGYVDEPACFGVPPYISPYIRTCAGVFRESGYVVNYTTIDVLRKNPALFSEIGAAQVVLVIAGMTVPGKYLGGTPAKLTELNQIAVACPGAMTCIGGPVTFGYAAEGGTRGEKQGFEGYDMVLEGEVAAALFHALQDTPKPGVLNYDDLDRWSVAGASIIKEHPWYPHVLCELETARGCSRSVTGGCGFCTEYLYGAPQHRSVAGIAAEVAALSEAGARHFRLGRQPDILTYGTTGSAEFPEPDPAALEDLFSSVRRAAPELKTLHIDNVNPGTIAHHEEASREALAVIVRYHTPGDVAAFGLESADPSVITANNLKASAEEVLRAISIVNEVGGVREEGIPHLLPGLNFVCGLAGETAATYEKNRAFLEEVQRRNLLVRRVNIRQLMPFEGTKAYEENTLGQYDREFRAFKAWVRGSFDTPMLAQVYPVGTVLRDLMVETEGPLSLARQFGSYPIRAGIPLPLPRWTVLDGVVVSHGARSVTVLPVSIDVNHLSQKALRWLPGVGKKKVGTILAKRPFADCSAFQAVAGETPVDEFLNFS